MLLRGTFYHLDALRFRLKIRYVAREDRFLSILFLIFESEGRASNKSKAKYGHPPQRGAGAGALLAEDEAFTRIHRARGLGALG